MITAILFTKYKTLMGFIVFSFIKFHAHQKQSEEND